MRAGCGKWLGRAGPASAVAQVLVRPTDAQTVWMSGVGDHRPWHHPLAGWEECPDAPCAWPPAGRAPATAALWAGRHWSG